ncbi:MAG: hypothetical protein D6706_16145, partial [Chloroflexi bacterium]
EKLQVLKNLVGDDVIKSIAGHIERTEKTAGDVGLSYKESTNIGDSFDMNELMNLPDEELDEILDAVARAKEAREKQKEQISAAMVQVEGKLKELLEPIKNELMAFHKELTALKEHVLKASDSDNAMTDTEEEEEEEDADKKGEEKTSMSETDKASKTEDALKEELEQAKKELGNLQAELKAIKEALANAPAAVAPGVGVAAGIETNEDPVIEEKETNNTLTSFLNFISNGQ